MKKVFELFCILISLTACSVETSCEVNTEKKSKKIENISLVCWNTQTFFDAETEGTEYSDFQSSGKWSKDKYLVRLKRLCEVIQELNADVYVLEEIENEAVIYDISNQLAGRDWNSKTKWNYACFSRNDNSSIGCAIISKYALSGVKTHNLDVRSMKEVQPEMRRLMEVTVNVGDYDFKIFAVHWKSKLGGEDSTELWRDWQEGLLGSRLADLADYSVVCGDFNRDAKDFVLDFGRGRSLNTIIRGIGEGGGEEVEVYSPWFNENGSFSTEIGSYWYEKNWERIDNILGYGGIRISSFSSKAEEPWANEYGVPNGYKIYNGQGYSDHLPLMCTLVLGYQE